MSTISPKVEKRRTMVIMLFISVMTGAAFHHSVDPIKMAFADMSLSFISNWAIPFIFIITILRFTIGNYLYTVYMDTISDLPEWLTVTDFVFLTLESLILIFAGSTCSYQESMTAGKGYFFFMKTLLFVDILWVGIQVVVGRLKRLEIIPYSWLILNSITLICLFIIDGTLGAYSDAGLIILAFLFALGAYLDTFIFDYYSMIKTSANKAALPVSQGS
jgi:hypothetical protein